MSVPAGSSLLVDILGYAAVAVSAFTIVRYLPGACKEIKEMCDIARAWKNETR